MSKPAEVELNEYCTACYGTTEYAEDMTSVILSIDGKENNTIRYDYRCREASEAGAKSVSAVIPPIETKVSMGASKAEATGYIKEGYAFNPMFTLGYTTTLKDKEAVTTWLRLEKAD